MENNNQIKPVNINDRVHLDYRDIWITLPKGMKPFEEDKIAGSRKVVNHVLASLPSYPTDNLEITNRTIPGPEGAPEIAVRIYKPKDSGSEKLPGILWAHGGGYLFGNIDSAGQWPIRLADQVKCISVVVDYRLAPEHPYPAGLEDCYAALVWVVQNAEELGIDVDRIVVGGESAGGGMSAALTLLARDRKGPKIFFQMPLYPMLDDLNITSSSYEITDERSWNRETNISAWGMYLKNYKGKETPIYAAPSRAKDLSGLPPAFFFIGDLDVFRDETIEYSQRLMQAGTPVELHVYSGGTHAFDVFFSETDLSKRVFSTGVSALKNAVSWKNTKNT